MSRPIAMFCDIDDFCKGFEPLYRRRLLQDGQRHRARQGHLALSELMTILVYFHSSHSRDFKHDDTASVATHLQPYFPALVSSSRFVDLLPRALVPLCGYLHTRKGRCTGITFVDSTSLAVSTPAASVVIKCSTGMPPEASRPWGGTLASSCT